MWKQEKDLLYLFQMKIITKSLEDSNVLMMVLLKQWNMKEKKQEGEFLPALLAPLATSLVQPVTYSVVKGIRERGVSRAGRGYMNKTFLVLLHPLTNIERDH